MTQTDQHEAIVLCILISRVEITVPNYIAHVLCKYYVAYWPLSGCILHKPAESLRKIKHVVVRCLRENDSAEVGV